MAKIKLGFDPQIVRKLVNRERWILDEPGQERRSIILGSVTTLTPSGKYYAPFACDNLNVCPNCKGTGKVRCRVKRRVRIKWENRNRRQRQRWISQYGPALNWPAHIRAASERLNALVARGDGKCPRCMGLGSHEAWDDEKWYKAAETALNAVGLTLEPSEGDGAYLLAVEYRDVDDNNDNEESLP